MTSYQYIKGKPKIRRRASWWVSFGLMGVGMIILFWVAWPIISFTITSGSMFNQVVTPIDQNNASAKSGSLSPLSIVSNFGQVRAESIASNDLTNANDWFPNSPQKKVVAPVNSYTISIPKLKITDAIVLIGGDDLNTSLIHYGGTGLPGEYGTAVIFGHSTLPQFFNPKNYHTIFSLLPTLKIGDDIWVTYDKVKYHYVVEDMIVTDPTDLTPLMQQFDDSHVTLVTCVPPGTDWKRLNVRARLQNI